MKKAILILFIFSNIVKGQSLLVSSGASNNFTVQYPANFTGTIPPSGIMLTFRSNQNITGASFLQINSLSSFEIKKNGNASLSANDIQNGHFVTVIFDGTFWQMLSVSSNPSTTSTDVILNQNTVNQSANFRITGDGSINGNLGIGTNIPTTNLHVVGGARIENIVGPGLVAADAAGNLSLTSGTYVQSGATGNRIPYMLNAINMGNSPIQTDGSWTSIGIAPSTNYIFRVDQTTSAFPAIYSMNSFSGGSAIWGYSNNVSGNGVGVRGQSSGDGYGIYGSNSGTGAGGYFDNSSTGPAIYVPNGNVGIGISNPSSKLEINGTSTTLNYRLSNISLTNTSGTAVVALGASVSNTSNNLATGISANVNNSGTGPVNGVSILAQGAGVGEQRGIDVTIGGTANGPRYGEYVAMTNSGTGTKYGIYATMNNTSGTNYGIYSNVSAAANNYAGIFMGGNVGIGTTSPQAPLHIYRNGFAGILLDQDGTNTLSEVDFDMATLGTGALPLANAATKGWRFVAYSNNNSNTSLQNDLRLNFYNGLVASPGLYFESANGNVGIYTNSAINKLDVGGNMAIGINYAATFSAPTNGLIIEGDVGIGTTAPGAKLDVGGIAANSLQAIFARGLADPSFMLRVRNGSGPLQAKLGLEYLSPSNDNASINFYRGGNDYDGYMAFSTANVERMTIYNNGNIGIGIPVPQSILHIQNAAGPNIKIQRDATVATSGDILAGIDFFDNQSAPGGPQASILVKRDAASSSGTDLPTAIEFNVTKDGVATPTLAMKIDNNGNVGIGASLMPPNARLAIKDGHFQSQQTVLPIPALQPAAGTGGSPSCTLSNATDVGGIINLTTGSSGWTPGAQCIITFNKPYATAPIVIITPANSVSGNRVSNIKPYATSTPNSFSINFATADISTNIYSYYYFIIETQ